MGHTRADVPAPARPHVGGVNSARGTSRCVRERFAGGSRAGSGARVDQIEARPIESRGHRICTIRCARASVRSWHQAGRAGENRSTWLPGRSLPAHSLRDVGARPRSARKSLISVDPPVRPTRAGAAGFCILASDDERRDPLDRGLRHVDCGRIGNQRGSCAGELRLRTPPSTAPRPHVLRTPTSSPFGWPL